MRIQYKYRNGSIAWDTLPVKTACRMMRINMLDDNIVGIEIMQGNDVLLYWKRGQ